MLIIIIIISVDSVAKIDNCKRYSALEKNVNCDI